MEKSKAFSEENTNKRLTHTSFLEYEWVKCCKNRTFMEDESNFVFTYQEFWNLRADPIWNDGWSFWD